MSIAMSKPTQVYLERYMAWIYPSQHWFTQKNYGMDISKPTLLLRNIMAWIYPSQHKFTQKDMALIYASQHQVYLERYGIDISKPTLVYLEKLLHGYIQANINLLRKIYDMDISKPTYTRFTQKSCGMDISKPE